MGLAVYDEDSGVYCDDERPWLCVWERGVTGRAYVDAMCCKDRICRGSQSSSPPKRGAPTGGGETRLGRVATRMAD